MAIQLVPFEPEAFFKTAESQATLLIDAFESGDAAYLADAIGIVARARGLDVPLKNEDLRLPALLTVAKALGVKLAVAA